MRRTALLLTVLVTSVVGVAQTPASPPPDPKLPIIRLRDGSISGLGPIYSQGIGFWIADTGKVAILASAEEFGETFAVAVAIQNNSDSMFTFDPSEIRAIDLVTGKQLVYIPPQTLANKIRRPGTWARFAQGFARGAALAGAVSSRQETTTASGDFRGQTSAGDAFHGSFNATGTTTQSDCDAGCAQAKANLMARFAQQDQAQAQRANAVESIGLAKETLLPKAKIMGYVYFSKPKKGRVQKPSGGDLDKSINVSVIVPVQEEKFHFFFPTELFDELTKH